MTYTTQELIQILDEELRATWKGKRILLSSAERIDNPVVAKAIDAQKLGKVFAYQDFRAQIHQYQQENRVSGIIWREVSFNNKSLRFPEVYNQLIPIAGDKETLIEAKNSVLSFWQQATSDLDFWLVRLRRYSQGNSRYQKISADYLTQLIEEAEWAEVDAARTEVYLGLCWGNPQEYQYDWANPDSGCHRIVATEGEPGAIKF